MANEKSTPLNEEQRANLEALAEKLRSASAEFHEALQAARSSLDPWPWTCRSCPNQPEGPICTAFVGDDFGADCQRPFCGHPIGAHVG